MLDAETIAAHWNTGGPDSNRRPVGTLLLSRWKVSVSSDDLVSTAAKIMTRRHTDVVAVTEPDGQLAGPLTARALVAALAGDEPHHAQRAANAPSLYRIEPFMPARHVGESRLAPE